MAVIIVSVLLLALLAAAGIAVVLDLTPDTRDHEFGIGPMLNPRRTSASRAADR
ncbi:MAG: hypothetical protein JWQ77_2363 [Jatrophihabitans sp.]|nr:hypothetical protein [Jatrophihabitans sp.]